jgi:hypothetical protein
VGPKAGLNTDVKGKILSPLPGIEPRSPGPPSPGPPARSRTLNCLSYPDVVAATAAIVIVVVVGSGTELHIVLPI